MNAIKEMDLEYAKLVRAEVEKKLAELEEKLGVKFSLGSGKYNSSSFDFKVSVNVVSEAYSNLNANELKFANNLKAFDSCGGFDELNSKHIGKEIVLSKNKFVIIGISSKRSNANVIGRDENGNLYKLDVDVVIKALK